MKLLTDLIGILTIIIPFVLAVEKPGDGADKKKAVVASVLAILRQPGGIDLPAFMTNKEEWFLGAFVEAAVLLVKLAGLDQLFKK